MIRKILHCGLPSLSVMVLLLALVPAPAGAQETGIENPLADPAAEARARGLMTEIRCVVCQAQSIAESDAAIAGDMRRLVRELVASGNSDADIRAYLTQRYGDFVLFKPPFKSATALLWVGPFVLLAIGLFMVIVLFRSNRAAGKAATLNRDEEARVRNALAAPDAAQGSDAS